MANQKWTDKGTTVDFSTLDNSAVIGVVDPSRSPVSDQFVLFTKATLIAALGSNTVAERAFNQVITFDQDVTYDPVFVQGSGTLAITKNATGNINGASHVLNITTNGNSITLSSDFKVLIGSVQYMINNPGSYEVFFLNQQSTNIQTVYVSIPGAVSTSADTTAPIWTTASFELGNIANNIIILPLNESIASTPVEATTAFTVLVDTVANVVTAVDLSNASQVRLTLTTAVTSGQTITVAYTQTANAIRDTSGNLSPDFTETAVTNNLSDTTNPAWTTASFEIGNVNDTTLVMPSNEALNTGPPFEVVGSFNVEYNAVSQTINSIDLSTANQVRLIMAAAPSFGEAVSVEYTASANPIRDVSNNAAPNLLETAVTNNIASGSIATYNFDSDTVGSSAANTTDWTGTHEVANETTLGNSFNFTSKTGGIVTNTFNIAQTKLTSVPDTTTDVQVDFRFIVPGTLGVRFALGVRAGIDGSNGNAHQAQYNTNTNDIRIQSIVNGSANLHVTSGTYTFSSNTVYYSRIKVTGKVLEVWITDVLANLGSGAAFVSFDLDGFAGYRASGGVTLNSGWGLTSEGDVYFDVIDVT